VEYTILHLGCHGRHCYGAVFCVKYAVRPKSIDCVLCGVRAEETASSIQHSMAQPDGCTPIGEINALFDLRGHTQLKQPTDTQ